MQPEAQFVGEGSYEPTIIDFDGKEIRPSQGEVALRLGGNRYLIDGEMGKVLSVVIEQAMRLVNPVLIYTLHPVKSISAEGCLLLDKGYSVKLPRLEVDPDVRYLAACVCTIGRTIENRCRQLTRQGNFFQSIALDAAGVAILATLANRCHERICRHGQNLQLVTGRRLSPGTLGLPIETQKILFQLVDSSPILVRLNEYGVMDPLKSLSFFVPLTTRRMQDDIPMCLRCTMRNCQFRIAVERKKS
jgi:hypothetical protein